MEQREEMMTIGTGRLSVGNGAILAIQLGDIGDVVLTLPSFHALKTAFPHNRLVVCVREKARELMEIYPDVDAVISVNKKKRSLTEAIRYQTEFLRTLRRDTYDLAIDFRTGTRGAFISLLSGARAKLGFFDHEGSWWRNRIFSHPVYSEYRLGTHVSDYYFELIRHLGISSAGQMPVFNVPSGMKQKVLRRLHAHGLDASDHFMVLQPFSLWHYKELHPDKYVKMIDTIGADYGIPIVLCGAPDEKERAQKIAARCTAKVINMAGATSIGELAALLSLAKFFIGVDSAGMHIAAAAKTPTASIFGPSAPASWAPRNRGHLVIQPNLHCAPCRRKGCDDTEISRCLDELTVDEIMDAVRPRLDSLFGSRVSQ